jgi:hypothetical protein
MISSVVGEIGVGGKFTGRGMSSSVGCPRVVRGLLVLKKIKE